MSTPESRLHDATTGLLRRLAGNRRSGPLPEMAREVLDGKLTLREAAGIGVYAEAMTANLETGLRQWRAMSPTQREQLAEQARTLDAAGLESFGAAGRAPKPAPAGPPPADRDEYDFGASVMRRVRD